jgi:putative endonuclease
MSNQYYVYVLASNKSGTLYIGITNDLKRRVGEHKEGLIEGFTKKYNIRKLVYFEIYNDINEAMLREKRLKKWNRSWKIRLIEEMNPKWNDLYTDFF